MCKGEGEGEHGVEWLPAADNSPEPLSAEQKLAFAFVRPTRQPSALFFYYFLFYLQKANQSINPLVNHLSKADKNITDNM